MAPGVSIDDFGASFIHYLPGVIEVMNNTSKARLLPTGKVTWEGEKLRKSVHIRRNVAIAGTVDGGAIPPAGLQSYVWSDAYRNFIVGSVKVTDGILDNASTTKNSAITVLESELRGLLDTMRKWENFMFTRDGTGIVALLGATTSGSTLTVTDGRLIWEGAYYDILDTDGATVHATFKVSSIARAVTAAGEATVTPTSSIASGAQASSDYIVWRGSTSAGDSSYNRVPMGLDGMIDDATGTFQGVNVTTYNRWTSPVLDNGGTARPIRPDLFRQALGAIKSESGDWAKTDMTFLTNHWSGAHVEEMYEGQMRITETTNVAGLEVAAFQSVMGRVKVVTDDDAPYKKAFFFDGSQITRASQRELDWRKQQNGIFKRSDDTLSWTATCLETVEYFIEGRNKCAKIEDLKETKSTMLG